jgi:predicted metalloendopeptidase
MLLTNPHSPAKYRVNGVVPNMDAWYKAFNVKPGEDLYLAPEQRVRIW